MPHTPDELLAVLRDLGIAVETVDHPPVFTVAEAKAHRNIDGMHVKNLFLRNKKKRMWLVVAREDRSIDLKTLAKRLDAGHVSFGSADRLAKYLGVEPGAVTPFGVINDDEHAVQVVLDAALRGDAPICCHPLTNAKTTAIAYADLLRFLEHTGHPPQLLDFDG